MNRGCGFYAFSCLNWANISLWFDIDLKEKVACNGNLHLKYKYLKFVFEWILCLSESTVCS